VALAIKDKDAAGALLAEINMIPLIDVMLVLLVIFIVTAPLLNHAVRIDLPRVSTEPIVNKPEVVTAAIDAAGDRFWNGARIDERELEVRLREAAQREPQPELHLSIDRTTQYRLVAEVMAAASKAGISRIGFVSDPREDGN
jgi:biopolymer transport protein ExbD